MQDLETLKQEISFTTTVKDLVKIYEELALMRMKKIRDSVLKTRAFAQTIYPIFFEVKNHVVSELGENVDAASFSTINRNGKNLTILLTPNDRLVGDIAEKVIKSYQSKAAGLTGDILIMGRTGKKIADVRLKIKDFYYFDLPEKGTVFHFNDIIKLIITYQNIEIFYPKFISFINQISVHENLSGQILPEQTVNMRQNIEHNYIFEPTAEDVLNFFEVEIFETVFKQKISEAELAKLGSRVIAMEGAARNAEILEKKLRLNQFAMEKSVINGRQLERLSGISLWGDRI